MLEYMFSHSFWGMCAWDIPSMIVLTAMVAIFVLRCRRMEKREDEQKEESDRDAFPNSPRARKAES